MFEVENARRRLEAIERAQDLLDDICKVLCDADVKNARVAKVIVACRKEFTDYQHVIEYAINRKEKHAYDQSARQERSKTAEEEVQSSGFARLPAEEGCLHAGVHHKPKKAEFG